MYFYFLFQVIVLICCILINKTIGNDVYYDDIQKKLLLKKLLNNFDLSNPIQDINFDKNKIKSLQEKYKSTNNFEENHEVFSEIKIIGRVISDFLIEFENSENLQKYDIINSELYIKYDIPSNYKGITVGKMQVYSVEDFLQIGKMLGNKFINFEEFEKKDSLMNINLNNEYLNEYINLKKNNLYMMVMPKPLNNLLNITINHVNLLMKVINKQKRKKRHNKEFSLCESDMSNESCCMKTFEINFDDLKWDFVISPRIIRTNYCYGECKKIVKKSTIGNVLSTIEDEDNFNYRSCCHPVEYKPLNVTIFINKSIIETKLINDLLVKKCSCY